MNLKCESSMMDRILKKRYEKTIKYLDRQRVIPPVLDIGDQNAFGITLSGRYGFKYYHTAGDLNYFWTAIEKNYDTVFCFEVIEHLINPGSFLVNLKRYIHKDTHVIISIPRHFFKRFWGKAHFHEMDEMRFRELVKDSGYKIIDRSMDWNFSGVTGIRPLIRFMLGYSLITACRRYYYTLTLEGK